MLDAKNFVTRGALFKGSDMISANNRAWLCRQKTGKSPGETQLFILGETVEELRSDYDANAAMKGIQGFERGQIDCRGQRDVLGWLSDAKKRRVEDISRKQVSAVRSWCRFEKIVA